MLLGVFLLLGVLCVARVCSYCLLLGVLCVARCVLIVRSVVCC